LSLASGAVGREVRPQAKRRSRFAGAERAFARRGASARRRHQDLEGAPCNRRLERGGVHRWGESNRANYQADLDFLLKWERIKEPIKAEDVVSNDLVADINAFDATPVAEAAKAAKP
jgi:hypothetical protein